MNQTMGSENIRKPSGRKARRLLNPIIRRATLRPILPRLAGNLHDYAQEDRQQHIGIKSRMPTSMASDESAVSRQPPLSFSLPRMLDQLHGRLPSYSYSAEMLKALGMARYAEALEQQSNRAEAERPYKRASALFEYVIVSTAREREREDCLDAVS